MFRGSIIEKLKVVDFLFKLNRFKVIEFGLMTLNFSKVPVVEVPGVLQGPTVPKYNNSACSIAHCKEVSAPVEANCSKCVLLCHT